jgi:hypothetical protein
MRRPGRGCQYLCTGMSFKEVNIVMGHFMGKGKNKTPCVESQDTQTAAQKFELTNLFNLTIFIIFVVVL